MVSCFKDHAVVPEEIVGLMDTLSYVSPVSSTDNEEYVPEGKNEKFLSSKFN